ncbi:MATE family efflux transporter [Sebaldella sp. S0638]|uniref:MATE family efflux transporter n=1 Tax=Sebaldella sp. S0638 TaxID=2957809 RepID=UPI00209EA668|nr:MATE family efflux transporter [Sebaldella sp. S0638]MCP1224823.1 MATE family efflux transporter [Sebaldella sp. S0638]
MERKKNLKNMLRYVIPSVTALMVNSVYIIVDGFFVMKGVGEKALAAVTLSVPFLEALIAVSMLLSVGAGIYISYYLGKGNKKTANTVLNTSVVSLLFVSVMISIFGIIFIKKLALILGADENMTELVCNYLKYLLYFSPALIFSYALATFLRNDNKPGLGMAAMIFGGLANGVLDYVFIFIFDMGIEGAGLATGLGPLFSIIIMLPHFFLKKGDLYFSVAAVSLKYCKKLFAAGMPAFITEYSLGIVTYLHNFVIIKVLGDQGVAAYGIIGYVALIILTLYLGISQGIQPLISTAYGAKKEKELKFYTKVSFVLAGIIGVVSTAAVMLFARPVVEIFSGNNTELTSVTVYGLRIYSINFILAGINILAVSIFQSVQKVKTASVIAVIRSTVFVYAALMVLPRIFGNLGIWMSMPFAEAGAFVVIMGIYFFTLKRERETAAECRLH